VAAPAFVRTLIGEPLELPPALLATYPELRAAHWRRGGLPVRVGGWCLGQRSAAAITLWRVVWLGADEPCAAELLLHEFRHVHQFEASVLFPIRYLWESARRGYLHNRYEADARAYAARRLRGSH
jgi:hypothetical protein